jgi:hypothetical protein
LVLIVLTFLAFSLALNIANPIWEAIDEPGHFQYVKFVAEHHALPGPDMRLPALASGSDANCEHSSFGQPAVRCIARGSVVNEPPLYYILEAPFVLPIDLNTNISWVANPYFTWWGHPLRNAAALHTLSEGWPYRGMVLGVHIMRAVSSVMVAGAVVAIYFTALAIKQSRMVALLAAATAAVTPGVLLSSATVNNDNAAILTGSLALMAAVKALTSAKRKLWLIVYALMAFFAIQSKASAYFLLPTSIVLAFLLLRRQGRRTVLASASGLLVAAALAGFALQTTRFNILALIRKVPDALRGDWNCNCTMFAQHYWGAIPNLWETYWGSYGWETFHPPPPMYRPFLAITLLGVAGLLWACYRKVRAGTLRAWLRSDTGASLILLVSAFFILLVIVDYRVLATHSDGGTTHARFLFPAFAASTIFLVLGIDALGPAWLRKAGFGLVFASCLSLIGFSIEALPKSYGPTVPVYGDAKAAGAQHLLTVDFDNGMQLLGWSLLSKNEVRTGQTMYVRLFWGATRPPDFDYSAFIRLDDGAGVLLHNPDHGAGQMDGLLSHAWQPGEVIPDDWSVTVPAGAHPGAYTLEAGVYDYRDMKAIPTISGATVLPLDRITITNS